MKSSDFELLLPVGQKEMALAAIHNGADAIYVGFPGFNARGRSYDFELNELKEIIQICHLYGVKVNLAFNIVIFESELSKVIQALEAVLPLKPDALIIQDLGLAVVVRTLAPYQVIHASTQMTVTNDLAINLTEDLNIRRYVLGRENSLSEIKLISERTKKELEVFVHGALCVSYSGQCFTSETLGGRSANRGQCAQSCRFSYDLIVDGEKKKLLDRQYLVSPQDLCGLAEIPQLMKLGIKSFKVEGRLKSPEYVARVAQSYRKAIDSQIKDRPLNATQIQSEKNRMAVGYSRGFFSGWLNGVNHQQLVDGTFSSHRGVPLGKVTKCLSRSLILEITDSTFNLENGDGLVWNDEKGTNGGFVYSIQKKSSFESEVSFDQQTVLRNSCIGSVIYLNHDRDAKKEIQKSFTDKNLFKKIPLKLKLVAELDQPLKATLSVSDQPLLTVSDQTESVLTKANKKPLQKSIFIDEFQSLSATAFVLPTENVDLCFNESDHLFLNHKEIKNLRQRLVQQLHDLKKSHRVEIQKDFEYTSVENEKVKNLIKSETDFHLQAKPTQPLLNLLLRTKEQVNDLCQALHAGQLNKDQIHSVTLDFEFGRNYAGSLEQLKSLNLRSGLATTRILKPQEYQNLKIIHSLNPDFILIRNLGALYYFTHIQPTQALLKGDFSLNVTNHLTAEYLSKKGLHSLCLSYDLNFEQSLDLLKKIPHIQTEITLHQSMPSFHMEHCVFAAFLSQGSSYKDCGKPCEKHKVQLKDQFGHWHWIKPDQECRNTMYNAAAQTALPYLESWLENDLKEVRFEALHEHGQELIQKIKIYQDVLEKKISIDIALDQLKLTESYGLSPGQLARSKEYESRKKDHSFLK